MDVMRILDGGAESKEKSKKFVRVLVIIAMARQVFYIMTIHLELRSVLDISRLDNFILNNFINELLQKYG